MDVQKQQFNNNNQEQQIPIFVAKSYSASQQNGVNLKNSTNNKRSITSLRTRTYSDTDSSYVPETTSESGISDLDMSEKCNCCPYGFHIDTDFVNFLETLDSKNLVKQLKKIQRKRNERLQRSMEYVIDEVEKIKQINDFDLNNTNNEQQLHYNEHPFPKPISTRTHHQSRSLRRISDQSPSRVLIPDTLKKTINEIDNEINRDFDPKLLIEHHKQRLSSRSNSYRREQSPSIKHVSRSPSRSKRSVSRTSIVQSERLLPINNNSSNIQQQQYEHKSRSTHRHRSKSHSRSPNLLPKNNQKYKSEHEYDNRGLVTTADEADEEVMMLGDQNNIETTTHTYQQQQIIQTQPQKQYLDTSRLIDNPIDVPPSQEITLNIVSLASSNSSSSESLCSDEIKLKINEVELPKQKKEKIIIETKTNNNDLYRRIEQLEKKLSKIPELEIRNNVLIEERNMLLKQLTERPKQLKDFKSIGINADDLIKRDVGVECKSKTRDVGVLHLIEEEKKDEKFIQLEAIINTLREKLDEQTFTMQKPATRDVAIMHQVDKIEEKPVKQIRDVAINHRTEDEQQKVEIQNMLNQQKEIITNSYVKELSILKKENVKLSSTLEEALKKRAVHVTTRGTSTPENPPLYSVGVNTSKAVTRDVQVMYTPKSRDVALSTDRFYYTRDVSLSCNLDKKPETRDVCINFNFEDKKQTYDACVGVNMQKETKDVSISVNTIEPQPEKPQQKNASIDTSSLHTYKDSCVGPDLQHLPIKHNRSTDMGGIKSTLINKQTSTNDFIFKRDAECSTIPEIQVFKRDFTANTNIEDPEKLEMAREIASLKMIVPKSTRDIAILTDGWSRLQINQVSNMGTHMDKPNLINKHQNTETLFKRESFTNTDKPILNLQNKACGDYNINEIQFSASEYNSLKTKLSQLELQTVKKEYKSQGVGLCSILDKCESEIPIKVIKNSVAVGNDEFILNSFKRTIACGDCKIDGNFCDRCSNKDIRSTGVGTVLFTRNEGCMTDLSNLNEKIGFLKQQQNITTINTESARATEDSLTSNEIEILLNKPNVNEVRKETEYEKRKLTRVDGNKKTIKETITMKLNDDIQNLCERSTWETVIDNNQNNKKDQSESSIVIPVNSPTNSKNTSIDTSDDNITTISTEEVTYKDGEILTKRPIAKLQLKPKGILKTNTSNTSNVSSKALKFGDVISKRLESESEEIVGKVVNDEEVLSSSNYEINIKNNEDYQLGEEGELHEIDENDQETIKTIKEEEDNNERYSTKTKLKQIKPKTQKSQRFELELELHIACCILNDSLYEPLKADKNKVEKALRLIQTDWFMIASQKDSNPNVVMDHLNAFYSRFSNLLLERIVNMTNDQSNTALHFSVSTGNFEIVNLLLDTKVCDVNAQNNAGYTSIMLAAVVPINNDYEKQTIKRLFSEGNVNIKATTNNQTALMLAVRHGNKEAVQLLLEANSDVNLQDKDGSTALMAACEHGYIDIVRLLLDNSNCDPDIKDNDGETAFDICKKAQRNDIIVLLYAHSSKMRSHHPALQFSKSRPRIGSAPSQKTYTQAIKSSKRK